MTTAATTLLGLALPVTGELQGTWGDTVNNSITSLLDTAVAGTTTLSTDGDVTLTTTTLATNQARQAILLCSGARTALRTITAPAQSKIYTVINNTTGGFSVKLVGVGPTTGVTIVAGESALVAWNGSDFIKISNTGGAASFTNVTVSGTTTLSGLTASTALALNASKEVVSVTNTGTGNNVLSASPTLTGTVGAAALTLSSDLTLSGGTANGVLYLNGSKVATSGSALTFDGTNLGLGVTPSAWEVGWKGFEFKAAGNALFSGGNADVRLTAGAIYNAGWKYGVSGASVSRYDQGAGSHTWYTAPSGTAGNAISFTQAMTLDASGRLGIGVTSPDTGSGTKLTVKGIYVDEGGSDAGYGWQIVSTSSGAAPLQLIAPSITFATGANLARSTRLTLDSSGNLGLGVTPSAWGGNYKAIQVNSTGAYVSNGSNATGLGHNYYYDGTNNRYLTTGAANLFLMINNEHRFYTAASGTAGNAISFTQAMTLDASGNLGIGTSSPGAKLETATARAATATSAIFGTTGTGVIGDQNRLIIKNVNTASGQNFGVGIGGLLEANASNAASLLFYYDGGAALLEGMRLNSSGNLGIGTSSPTNGKLEVQTSSTSAGLWIQTGGTTSSYTIADFRTGTNLSALQIFGDGSSSWRGGNMVLDSSGNLGLGVTPSAWATYTALQIKNGSIAGYSPTNDFRLSSNAYYNAGWKYISSAYGVQYLQDGSNGQHQWFIAPSGTAGAAITFTQAMTLDASGNLLVGTTSAELGAGYGNIQIQGSSGAIVQAQTSAGTVRCAISTDSSNGYAGTRSNHPLILQTNNTERARIDSSGNFNVGTAIADAGRLNINGVGGTSSPTSLYIQTSASGTTDYALRIYNSGTTALFTIRTDGVVNTGAATNSPVNLTTANAANVYVGGASGTLYKSTSSRKYKRDIENTPRGLADLLKLRAVIYKQKTADVDGNIPDTVHGGLIAEEVHDAGLTEFVQYADDGTPDALAYGHMVSLCVKAIQEQQVLIQQLTARVAQLEAKGA